MAVSIFFFNDTATTEIYTLSLHDALPICCAALPSRAVVWGVAGRTGAVPQDGWPMPLVQTAPGNQDRKSTRLNSSHANISYAVFCLKKKNLVPHYTILYPCSQAVFLPAVV